MSTPNALFPGRYRWLICSLLFLATTINYVDRQILSLVKETLDKEIGWSNTQFGLVNSAFQLSYAVGLLSFGWIVDRFGTKLGYAISIFAWSVAAIGHSLVGSLRGFFAARISLGVGEGGNFPSAIKATALWFPINERALATSLFNSGANVGAIVAPAIVPWIADKWGWQSAFVAAGIAGILWLGLWWPLYNTPEKVPHLTDEERQHIASDKQTAQSQKTESVPWFELLRHRQTWSFIVAKGLTDPIWWFFLIWLPDFFKSTRGLEIKKSWVHIVAIYSIITLLSVFGGWITGYLANKGWTVTRARKTGMIIFAFLVMPIFFVTKVGDWTAVLIIALAGSAHQAWSANLYTTVSDMFPKRAVASVVGIGGMAGAACGALFPTFSGWILDSAKAAGNITTGYSILFAICASGYAIAFVIHHFLAPKFEQIHLE